MKGWENEKTNSTGLNRCLCLMAKNYILKSIVLYMSVCMSKSMQVNDYKYVYAYIANGKKADRICVITRVSSLFLLRFLFIWFVHFWIDNTSMYTMLNQLPACHTVECKCFVWINMRDENKTREKKPHKVSKFWLIAIEKRKQAQKPQKCEKLVRIESLCWHRSVI